MSVHGQMGGQNEPECILEFRISLVLWGNVCNKYHIVYRALLFIVLLVLLDIEFVALIPLP